MVGADGLVFCGQCGLPFGCRKSLAVHCRVRRGCKSGALGLKNGSYPVNNFGLSDEPIGADLVTHSDQGETVVRPGILS